MFQVTHIKKVIRDLVVLEMQRKTQAVAALWSMGGKVKQTCAV